MKLVIMRSGLVVWLDHAAVADHSVRDAGGVEAADPSSCQYQRTHQSRLGVLHYVYRHAKHIGLYPVPDIGPRSAASHGDVLDARADSAEQGDHVLQAHADRLHQGPDQVSRRMMAAEAKERSARQWILDRSALALQVGQGQ